MNVDYVDTPDALIDVCNRLAGSAVITLDTEFIRETTYYPRLCLIQIADARTAACIDPLALTDLAPLKALLLNPDVLKVVHAGRQDMEIFFHLWGAMPAPLFDTQIAASLLGYGDSVGYDKLVDAIIGVHIDKTHTRSDWSQRPLHAEQIDYAAADVIHLLPVFEQVQAELQKAGRLDWLKTDFDALINPQTYRVDPNQTFRRIKGYGKLKRSQLVVLQSLAAWRETKAMETDRPKRRLAGDDALLAIARVKPANVKALAAIRGVPENLVGRFGAELVDVVVRAMKRPESEWPELRIKNPLTREQEALLDAVSALLKSIAFKENLTPAILANRGELEDLLRGDTDIPLMSGWRLAHAGTRVRRFLEGELSMEVRDGQLNFIERTQS